MNHQKYKKTLNLNRPEVHDGRTAKKCLPSYRVYFSLKFLTKNLLYTLPGKWDNKTTQTTTQKNHIVIHTQKHQKNAHM